jgi:hypothetical protein
VSGTGDGAAEGHNCPKKVRCRSIDEIIRQDPRINILLENQIAAKELLCNYLDYLWPRDGLMLCVPLK